jgi:UDP-glucose 6-dehydrogenase
MLKNGWIHPMHTKIPGPDDNISYGGACFPKDTKALLHYMKEIEVPHEVLDACVREREKMRDD